MILVISTSSPISSVALFRESGDLIHGSQRDAPKRASGAVISLINQVLNESDIVLSDVNLFVADVGPGSFTGLRVGVTIAKTLAFCFGKQCAAIDAFDLIATSESVVIPCRRDQWYRRDSGAIPQIVGADEISGCVGYGIGIASEIFPDAIRADNRIAYLQHFSPEQLNPNYLAGPSISTPKRAYATNAEAPI